MSADLVRDLVERVDKLRELGVAENQIVMAIRTQSADHPPVLHFVDDLADLAYLVDRLRSADRHRVMVWNARDPVAWTLAARYAREPHFRVDDSHLAVCDQALPCLPA